METANHLHADTSFAEKSMADVLAQAQQDSGDGDEGADTSMHDANDSPSNNIKESKDSPQKDSPSLSDVVEHDAHSPSRLQNGHTPQLKFDLSEIKAQS